MEHDSDWDTFTTSEVGRFWRYIVSSLERLMAVGRSLDLEGLHWQPAASETNCVAVLIHHTLGNAEENVLGVLCGEDIARKRETEFLTDPATVDALDGAWSPLRPRLEQCLAALGDEALNQEFQHPRRGTLLGLEVLIVVARHAAEHLGQAELTRDLWNASRSGTKK